MILSLDSLKFIISRLVSNANDAVQEARADRKDLFAAGKSLAYYEMLDVIQTELDVREQDLKEFGLNVDLLKDFV